MTNQELTSILKLFQPPWKLSGKVVSSIDSLSSLFHDGKDYDELFFQIGEDSLLLLEDLKLQVWNACKYIVQNRRALEYFYYQEILGDCFILRYNKQSDDYAVELFEIVFENGKVVDIIQNHPKAMDFFDTAELEHEYAIGSGPSLESYCYSQAKNNEERLEIANSLYGLQDIDPSFCGRYREDGWGKPIEDSLVSNKLMDLKEQLKKSLDSIELYLKHEKNRPRVYDEILKYTGTLAQIINHKIFVQDVDCENLAVAFSCIPPCSLTIKKQKESAWIRILKVISENGPEICRGSEWFNSVAEYWNLSSKLHNRMYGTVGKTTQALIDDIEYAFEEINNR